MVYKRINKLCKKQRIGIHQIEKIVGLPNGTIRKWKTETPNLDDLQKVAMVLSVSASYLLEDPDGTKREVEREFSRIEIKTDDSSPLVTRIYINGQELRGVRNYSLTHDAGGVPILKLDINALNFSVDHPRARLQQRGIDGYIKITREEGLPLETPSHEPFYKTGKSAFNC